MLDKDPEEGSEEYERLEFLAVLVKAYEDESYPFEDATPHEVIDFMLGGRSRVSEFYSGKRSLSLGQIKRLNAELGIPADILLQASE